MKHSLKKIRKILTELSYAQAVALRNSDLNLSLTKLFSFLKKDFRSDELIDSISLDIENLNEEINKIALNNQEENIFGSEDHEKDKSSFEFEASLLTSNVLINNQFDWNIDTTEPEDIFYLHRFGWLIQAVSKDEIGPKTCFEIINHWITKNNNNNANHGWDAYSISERVSNMILLLLHFPEESIHSNKIKKNIIHQLRHLIKNLEFRGSVTNNHLLNNAKALYVGGSFISISDDPDSHYEGMLFKKAGRIIITKFYSRVFSESGMNNEGSSHYQLIFTKWVLEVLRMSHLTSDLEMISFLKERATKNLQASYFFLSFSDFPFIGDISPDLDLDFFGDLPLIGQGIIEGELTNSSSELSEISGIGVLLRSNINNSIPMSFSEELYQQDGYYVIRKDKIRLLFFLNPHQFIASNSHAHCDAGSFVLWFEENIIFNHTGRQTYKNIAAGDQARSIISHNGIRLNGSEPMLVHNLNTFPELHTKKYIGKPININSISDNEIIIRLSGYRRKLNTKCEVVRSFLIDKKRLLINDSFVGGMNFHIETFFQLEKKLNVQETEDIAKLQIYSEDNEVIATFEHYLEKKEKFEVINRNTSSKYGLSENSKAFIFRQFSSKPMENKYIINFNTKSKAGLS